mmetsp:Transcript_25162/g.28999  ORF Transcript_25162/g.28999 Transcript_25162/m.28999 type:complete len:314 (-) Transcript_25162:171-1112(-)
MRVIFLDRISFMFFPLAIPYTPRVLLCKPTGSLYTIIRKEFHSNVHQMSSSVASKKPVTNTASGSTESKVDGVRESKAALRTEIRSKLKSLSQEQVEDESFATWSRIESLPAYKAAKTVGIFLSMPKGEINTDQLLVDVQNDVEKSLFVPRVGLNFEKCDMDLVRVVSGDNVGECDEISLSKKEELFYHAWPRNKWRIPEPPMSDEDLVAKAGDLDVLLVPGVAFDKSGGRLGHGKGYYDRFIERMRSNHGCDGKSTSLKKPYLIGVGLSPQLLEAEGLDEDRLVPTLGHDYQMDHLLFPHCSIEIVPLCNYE